MTKKCSKCDKKKPLSEFYRRSASKDGFQSCCKMCEEKFAQQYRQTNKHKQVRAKHDRKLRVENPELYKKKRRKSTLKINYGITLDEYNQMFESQKGVCAICDKPETANNQIELRNLSVNHKHQTNKIRRLL